MTTLAFPREPTVGQDGMFWDEFVWNKLYKGSKCRYKDKLYMIG